MGAAAAFTRSMPHFGQEPGLSETTSGSIGQTQTVLAAAAGFGRAAGAGGAGAAAEGAGAGVPRAERAALRLDSESIRKFAEVTTRSPSGEPREHRVAALDAVADRDLARLEPAVAAVEEHDPAIAGAQHRALGDEQLRAEVAGAAARP